MGTWVGSVALYQLEKKYKLGRKQASAIPTMFVICIQSIWIFPFSFFFEKSGDISVLRWVNLFVCLLVIIAITYNTHKTSLGAEGKKRNPGTMQYLLQQFVRVLAFVNIQYDTRQHPRHAGNIIILGIRRLSYDGQNTISPKPPIPPTRPQKTIHQLQRSLKIASQILILV